MSDMTAEHAQALLDGATPGPWLANGEPWNLIVWSPDSKTTGKDNCAWYLFDQRGEGPAVLVGRVA